jgi:quinol monooxygenase YgiN
MIIISGSVRIKPERRADAVRGALEMAAATAREPGCITYRFSADLADPSRIYIFEEWETAEALARHFETDHMRVFQQSLPDLLAEAPAIKRYVVESAGAL